MFPVSWASRTIRAKTIAAIVKSWFKRNEETKLNYDLFSKTKLEIERVFMGNYRVKYLIQDLYESVLIVRGIHPMLYSISVILKKMGGSR